VDRLVTCGELVEQNKKLEAVRALLYRTKHEYHDDTPASIVVRRQKIDFQRVDRRDKVFTGIDAFRVRVC
jgi:hypothetical protein